MFKLVMMLGITDPRLKQALGEWAQIAPGLGLDSRLFRAKLIWQKKEPDRSHVVIRLRGPRGLILKRVFTAPQGGNSNQSIAAQRDAFERLVPYDKAHAPEVLFANDTGNIVVMVEASGKTLNDHLSGGRAHGQMLKRTGAWLAAFHVSSETEKRIYQPRFMVNHAERMASGIEAGQISVADPQRFVTCCRLVSQHAAKVTDQATISAAKHGDFNLRNILLGPNGETGLDFKPQSSAPVGFDIARILMDYAELFQPTAELEPGTLLSKATLDGFFRGYNVVTRDDPAVTFLPFVQLLNDWRLIPSDPARRSWRQTERYKAITALAQNGFGVP